MPTFSADSLLALRFSSARPGLELVAIVDAALPVALLTADVLAQDRKALPLLEEFVLRLVGAGISTEEEITGFLGLQPAMVTQTIASHLGQDNLTYASAGATPVGAARRQLRLTGRGTQTARDLASITPRDLKIELIYDQLLCKVRPYERNAIVKRDQAEDSGILILPSARSAPVETADVSTTEINELIRDRDEVKREVLLIKKITQAKARRVMPAKVLVYTDPKRRDIQLAVVIDDELSSAHELALLNQDGATALGIQVEAQPQRPELDPELERARVPLADVLRQQSATAAVRIGGTQPAPHAQTPERGERTYEEVRAVSVFEHPDLLDEALTQAMRRILIISPWVKKAVVSTDFLGKLDGRLKRGVVVCIAYGIGNDDKDSDAEAIRKLNNLAGRYPDKFTFVRLKNAHAKILIFDNVWVTTSFNWLSFRGDRNRTYRMEEGNLVRSMKAAEDQYQRYLGLISQNRQ